MLRLGVSEGVKMSLPNRPDEPPVVFPDASSEVLRSGCSPVDLRMSSAEVDLDSDVSERVLWDWGPPAVLLTVLALRTNTGDPLALAKPREALGGFEAEGGV